MSAAGRPGNRDDEQLAAGDADRGGERAYAANVLAALAVALTDRINEASQDVVGHGATAPAALVSLYWYPGRPVRWLAARLNITHPGAVQLAQRLERAGLLERGVGPGGRTRPLTLTPAGETMALAVMRARQSTVLSALDRLQARQVRSLALASGIALGTICTDLLGSEHICRLCDEAVCPDSRCPAERAVPSPAHRRGRGYGVPDDLPEADDG